MSLKKLYTKCRVVRKFLSRQLSCQSEQPALEVMLNTEDASLWGVSGHAPQENF